MHWVKHSPSPTLRLLKKDFASFLQQHLRRTLRTMTWLMRRFAYPGENRGSNICSLSGRIARARVANSVAVFCDDIAMTSLINFWFVREVFRGSSTSNSASSNVINGMYTARRLDVSPGAFCFSLQRNPTCSTCWNKTDRRRGRGTYGTHRLGAGQDRR